MNVQIDGRAGDCCCVTVNRVPVNVLALEQASDGFNCLELEVEIRFEVESQDL